MVKVYSEQQVREALRVRVRRKGILTYAEDLNVSDRFVYAVLRGERPPSAKLLDDLGLERVVRYTKKEATT